MAAGVEGAEERAQAVRTEGGGGGRAGRGTEAIVHITARGLGSIIDGSIRPGTEL